MIFLGSRGLRKSHYSAFFIGSTQLVSGSGWLHFSPATDLAISHNPTILPQSISWSSLSTKAAHLHQWPLLASSEILTLSHGPSLSFSSWLLQSLRFLLQWRLQLQLWPLLAFLQAYRSPAIHLQLSGLLHYPFMFSKAVPCSTLFARFCCQLDTLTGSQFLCLVPDEIVPRRGFVSVMLNCYYSGLIPHLHLASIYCPYKSQVVFLQIIKRKYHRISPIVFLHSETSQGRPPLPEFSQHSCHLSFHITAH